MWENPKGLKESNPIEVVEYAVVKFIVDKKTVEVTLLPQEKEKILYKVKFHYWKRAHKFGVQLPKKVDELYQIDKDSGTEYWR